MSTLTFTLKWPNPGCGEAAALLTRLLLVGLGIGFGVVSLGAAMIAILGAPANRPSLAERRQGTVNR